MNDIMRVRRFGVSGVVWYGGRSAVVAENGVVAVNFRRFL